MAGPTILQSNFVFYVILPFVLVFALVFAVLEKSEILGKGKHQINAIISLVIGLIVVSFGYAVDIITGMIPFLAVALVIILVFLVLVGALYKEGEFKLHDNVRWAMVGIIAISVVIAALYFTGAWDYLYGLVNSNGEGSNIVTNVVFVAIIIAVIGAVLWGSRNSGSGTMANK